MDRHYTQLHPAFLDTRSWPHHRYYGPRSRAWRRLPDWRRGGGHTQQLQLLRGGHRQQLQLGWAGAQQPEVYTEPGSVPYYAGRYKQRRGHGARPAQHWSYYRDYHEPYWDQDQYHPLRSYLYYGLDPYMLFGLLSFLTFIFYVTFRLLVNNGQGRSLQESSGAEISSYIQHFVNSDP